MKIQHKQVRKIKLFAFQVKTSFWSKVKIIFLLLAKLKIRSSNSEDKKYFLIIFEILKVINQDNKIPLSIQLIHVIYEQLNEKSNLLKEFKSKLAKEQTEVKIRIYENEKEFLLESKNLQEQIV